MKKAFGLSALLSLSASLWAQVQLDTSLYEKNLDEVILFANKFAERKKNIAQKIELITAGEIARQNSQNTGDLLINTGTLFVQKSQQGGSSPVIRGFEASRVLLVVDGIRMNNAIYRAGHLQNVITVDQNMLERVEVLYGPGSTLYGSDALGGAVLLRTKMPQLSGNGRTAVTGNAFARYSTANREKTVHADASIGGRKWAWLQSYTYSDFDDTKTGDRYPDDYPNFGRRSQYITTINGMDSIVANKDDRVQRFSGYRQWDILQKVLFRPSEKVSHLLNLQLSGSSNVPRYDRLQDVRNGQLRWAEWYYGPQQRQLAAYELNVAGAGFFTSLKSIVSYQHIEESRHQRAYRNPERENRLEKADVWNITIDGRKLWGRNELTLGADAQLNDVHSTAFRENRQTGARGKLDTRYPNGKNNMNYYGIYGQHLLKLKGDKWVLNDGLRLQAVRLHSTIADNSFFNFPFTQFEQNNLAATGNIGLIYMPDNALRISGSLASGFRSPNVDDASRVFETSNNQLVVPNPDIKPEYTYTADLSIARKFGDKVRLEVTGFYTWFRNAIALAPFRLNGQETVLYNGASVRVFANQNVNKAFLYGAHANFSLALADHLQLASALNYTYGRLKKGKDAEVPADHIPPLYGKTGITYGGTKIQAEAYALYNGWKRLKDYNPDGEDNLQYATPDGMPPWWTLNLKTSVGLAKGLLLQLGVENILDRNYRYFASGFSAPGRNFILALRGSL